VRVARGNTNKKGGCAREVDDKQKRDKKIKGEKHEETKNKRRENWDTQTKYQRWCAKITGARQEVVEAKYRGHRSNGNIAGKERGK